MTYSSSHLASAAPVLRILTPLLVLPIIFFVLRGRRPEREVSGLGETARRWPSPRTVAMVLLALGALTVLGALLFAVGV